MAVYVEEQP